MSIPGKEAYKRKTEKSGKQGLNRKKVAMSGSDAHSAYKRKKQPASASTVARSLRTRLRNSAD